jgi:3-oxoacyl-[acyl-carrier-protein] synthase III
MTRDAYLSGIAYALGDRVESVEQAVAYNATVSSAAVFRAGGFARHHRCSPELAAYDLAYQAVTQIGALADVDAIIYATALPCNANLGSARDFGRTRDVKDLMRFAASRLQADFGLRGAAVFGLDQQACTGALGAMRLARSLIAAEPDMRNVLCVTADRFPEGALYEQAYNLVSDGAAAWQVSAAPTGLRIVACHQLTNGALACASDDETVGSFFSHALAAIRGVLDKARLRLEDVQWIVPQNTHAGAWKIVAGLLPFAAERIYFPALAETGHVISADNLINLKHLLDADALHPGDRVLLFMAGYGLNWQCVLLEKPRS